MFYTIAQQGFYCIDGNIHFVGDLLVFHILNKDKGNDFAGLPGHLLQFFLDFFDDFFIEKKSFLFNDFLF